MKPPPVCSSISCSVWCVSSVDFPVAIKTVSSMKARVSLLGCSCAMSMRSALYIMYIIMERGSPCPIPLVIGIQSDLWPSNMSFVFLSSRTCSVKLTSESRIFRCYMLCRRHSVTVFASIMYSNDLAFMTP